MMHGKQIKRWVEAKIPGAYLEYGYHGCFRASVTVWHDASGHTSGNPLVVWSCRCEEWGDGRLDVRPSELVRLCNAKLAKTTQQVLS